MQRSALIREELEDAVAGMSPAARTVFDDIKRGMKTQSLSFRRTSMRSHLSSGLASPRLQNT